MRTPDTIGATREVGIADARWAYRDGELAVVSGEANPGIRAALVAGSDPHRETSHFDVFALDGSTVVLHRLEPAAIDNDLAELVAGELVRPGLVRLPRAFERCFAGVVLSSAAGLGEAWRGFYENTLSKLERAAPRAGAKHHPTAVFGGIYTHARSLIAGSSVLDVGTCFGFFPLLLRRRSTALGITALDLSAPTLRLAADAASRLRGGGIEFVRGDARELPFVDGSFDTVTALHVLEHLDDSSAKRAVREACRVARRRVAVAVPLEEQPDTAYGHAQSFDREALTELGESSGWRCDYEEYLGGWAVLEPL
jgi:2-polyprenyl-3-methyl-5-hydroxy-6-metoxy-1,4-benzoquinol methylase